jgi:hypothetical protein
MYLTAKGDFIRSVPFANAITGKLVLRNDVLVANDFGGSPNGVALALHLWAPSAAHIRSFDEWTGPITANQAWLLARVMSEDRRGGLWTAWVARYRVEHWSADGRRLQSFQRAADWFPEATGVPSSGALGTRPATIAQAIQQDSLGRVWVIISMARDDWKNALGPPQMVSDGLVGYPARDSSGLYESVIEVIDPASGTLVSSRRVPYYLQYFPALGEITGYRQDADGVPYIDIYRIDLQRPPGAPRANAGGEIPTTGFRTSP